MVRDLFPKPPSWFESLSKALSQHIWDSCPSLQHIDLLAIEAKVLLETTTFLLNFVEVE